MTAIEGLVQLFERAEKESQTSVGLWREGGTLSLADVMAAPCKSNVESTPSMLLIYDSTRDLPCNERPDSLPRLLSSSGRRSIQVLR